MPELPEVETIKNELVPHVIGRSISSVTLFWERMLRQPSPAEFHPRISGQKITGLSRRGKYLIFQLGGGGCLITHLKMSGSLLVGRGSPPEYTRAIIHLDNGTDIFFRDIRKFGTLQLVKNSDSVLCKLGTEPLSPGFTPETLYERLKKRKAPIKAVLIDQGFIAGIGNMYADEALFDARIHPTRTAGSLSGDEIERLHGSIRRVLLKALNSKGASVRNYIRPDGSPGTAHDEFNVAHGVGKNCPRCGTPIKRIVVRGRGTYFCPECQRV